MAGANKDVMLRTWELLQRIPQRAPGKTARQLLDELDNVGYSVSKKMLERDLSKLLRVFPIHCNADAKPYLWHWRHDASLKLPGVAVAEALSLVLAEETLKGLMHKSLLGPLQGRLDAAKRLLTEARGSNRKSGWADKIRSVPRDLILRPPAVDSKILDVVQDAVLSDRQLEIDYRSLQDTSASWRTVNPRALLLKGSVMYLLADKLSGDKGSDGTVKQYALHRIRATRTNGKPVFPGSFNWTEYMKAEEHEVGSRRAVRVRLKVETT